MLLKVVDLEGRGSSPPALSSCLPGTGASDSPSPLGDALGACWRQASCAFSKLLETDTFLDSTGLGCEPLTELLLGKLLNVPHKSLLDFAWLCLEADF